MGPKMSGHVVSCRVLAESPRGVGHGSDGETTGHDLVGLGPTSSAHNTPAPIRASSLSWEGDPVISDLGYFSRAVWCRTTGRPVCSWFRCVSL